MSDKLGDFYIKIQADVNKLNDDISKLKRVLDKDLPKVKVDFDTAMGRLKIDQLERYYNRLKIAMQKKIMMDADVASIRRTAGQLKQVEEILESIKGRTENTETKLSRWSMILTGINQGFELVSSTVTGLKDIIMSSVNASNQLDVLKSNFAGTADNLELFKKATAGTVDEANLIKLSNQATDLGISLEQQALFFSLAEDAADKYGTSVEDGMIRVISASEGNTRALKSLGIQREVYEGIVKRLALAEGQSIANLDAETQKQISLNAIIEASGITIDKVKNKVKDNADKFESLSVRVQEAKIALGSYISKALMPLIDAMDKSGEGSKNFASALIGVSSVAIQAVPLLIQLRSAQALLAASSVTTATAVNTSTTAVVGFKAALMSLLPWMGVLAIATAGTAMLYNYSQDRPSELANKDEEQRNKTTYKKPIKPLLNNNTSGGLWFHDPKYTSGASNVNQEYKTTGRTVGEIINEIERLKTKQNDLIVGSQAYKENVQEINRLTNLISNKAEGTKTQDNYFNSVKFLDKDYLKYRKELITKSVELFRKQGKDAVAIKQWEVEELKKLSKEEYEFWELYNKDRIEKKSLSDIEIQERLDKKLNNSNFKPITNIKTENTQPIGDFEEMENWARQTEYLSITYDSFIEGAMAGMSDLRMKVDETSGAMTKALAGFVNYAIQAAEQIFAKWAILNVFSFITGGSGIGLGEMLGFSHGGTIVNNHGNIQKFASGGSFVVPSGFPNDSYPMLVESGERVTVTPANQTRQQDNALLGELRNVKTAIQALNMNLAGQQQGNINLGVELQSTIKGDDIYMSNQQVEKRKSRFR